jgi:hypothetical protein
LLSGNNSENLYFFFFVQTFGALFPSAMYLFVHSMLSKKVRRLNPVFVLSFIIGLIPIFYFVQYSSLPIAEQNVFYQQLTSGLYPEKIALYNIIFYTFQQSVFAWLLMMCYKALRKQKEKISSITKTKVNFLQVLLWVFFSANCMLLLASLLFDVLLVEYLLLPISLIILHSSTVYYSFRNSEILSKEESEALEIETRGSTFVKTDLLGVLKLLENSLSTDSDWENFKRKFNDLNPHFIENLLCKHPELSKSEIRLLTLIRIGYSQKEIAHILAIEPDSVKKAKSRVRKKLNMPKSIILTDYLSNT